MKLFKGSEQGNNSGKLEEINTKTITRRVNVLDTICTISIEDAKVGKVDGKEVILDEVLVNNTFNEIVRVIGKNSSKYNPIPKRITISHRDGEALVATDKEEDNVKEEFLNIYKPRWGMEDVYIEEQSKKQILIALTIARYKDKLFNEWGLNDSLNNGRAVVLNFWGPPGTGKSMAAEAIANYLKKQVYSVNYAELESKYVGDTPKNVKKAFQRASENDAVLIFDEADSFLGKRLTNVSQSADYGVNITRSVMLLELEKFDGVVIFTTNLINNYDDAFKRRILASVEFKNPNLEGREEIWKAHLPKKLPLEDNITPKILAVKYEKTSGADIKDMVLYAAVLCLQRNGQMIELKDFDEAYKFVMNRYALSEKLTITSEVITKEQYEKEMMTIDEKNH
ncbi:ATPase AAA [Clostridium carboxidivorans P7]|uniref:AAA ATPase central domain protein n=1 Tax=Clostridium carboxidivorans P7 TaxID=536227 RepID=C6PSE2_9CLOT|nr:ATP-binding protein [Clostridium carboxidivorans]AKN32599.1 ATPase AAA [Clostridium carboxidivorans P7]EET87820.1 AAA ATPase central domain protein [Clostridium carboxidivorans P7]EFG90193.1 ATPase, AAA family [Clostridium carboxidivorans P7]